jgi:site-specific DNA-methyltransferase (adenine-specific)
MILDPFAGSGTTGEAAWKEGFRCHLIEREEKYCQDIEKRLTECQNEAPKVQKTKPIVKKPEKERARLPI